MRADTEAGPEKYLHGTKVANVAFILLQLELKGLARSDDLRRYVRTVKEGVL